MTPTIKLVVHPVEALRKQISTHQNRIFIITFKCRSGIFLKKELVMNHNIDDFLTKKKPDPVCHLGEKLKTSPTRKFAANTEIALQTLTV
jgi:hypothetical protein